MSPSVCWPKSPPLWDQATQGVGLWLKVIDMNHTVLIPREKGQCGQQDEQGGDPDQGRRPTVSRSRCVTFLGSTEEKEAISDFARLPKDKLGHPSSSPPMSFPVW